MIQMRMRTSILTSTVVMSPYFNFRNLWIPLFVLCLCVINVSAQIQIRGEVRTEQGEKIDYASVGIQQGEKTLAFLMTDESGNWEASLPEAGKYLIITSQLGYGVDSLEVALFQGQVIQTILKQQIKSLAEVTVTSNRPVIIRKADRFIVQIENSYLSSGYDALDLLQRSPGIWVGSDGVIKLRGTKSIAVMINGVLQRMSYDELTDFLKGIRSENISKLEVVTNPGAEFDAEGAGGFVNIVLKKLRNDGLQGSANYTYRHQRIWPYQQAGIQLNWKKEKWQVFGGLSGSNSIQRVVSFNNADYANDQYYYTDLAYKENALRWQGLGGVVYQPNDRNTIGLQHLHTGNDSRNDFNTLMLLDFGKGRTTGVANSLRERNGSRNTTTLNFTTTLDTLGSTFTFIADHTWSKSEETLDFNSRYSNASIDSIYRNNAPYATRLSSAQVDFNKTLKHEASIKNGLKYSNIVRDNELVSENFIGDQWELDPGTSNRFQYKEQILAAYSSFSKVLKKQEFTVGIRVEHTIVDGISLTSGQSFDRDYTNVFPTLNYQYTWNQEKGHAFVFSLNAPFNRPDFSILNPYRFRTDNFTYQIGNPNLLPQTGYALDAGVNLWNDYNFGIYYTKINKAFAQYLSQQEGNIIEYQYRNFSYSEEGGVYVSAPWNITKDWNVNFYVYGNYLSFRLPGLINEQFAWFGQCSQTMQLGKWGALDIMAEYHSPYVYSNAKAAYQFGMDAGYVKYFFNKKIRIRLAIFDIFDTRRDKVVTTEGTTVVSFYQKRPTRIFGITVNYNFQSGTKFDKKSVQQGASDEKNRLD